MKKKWIRFVFFLMFAFFSLYCSALCGGENSASEVNFHTGEYFQIGQYNGEPILWFCANEADESGKLIVSDKILCFKAFDARSTELNSIRNNGGVNFWEESNLRAWLNSTAEKGRVIWPGNNPPTEKNLSTIYNLGGYPFINDTALKYSQPYADEKGFLAEGNFTKNELSLMKTVNQWIELSEGKKYLATNGKTEVVKMYLNYGNDHEVSYGVDSKFPKIDPAYPYGGAMYKVTDTMFLLSLQQASQIGITFGTAAAEICSYLEKDYREYIQAEKDGYYSPEYWLRSPYTLYNSIRTICENFCYEIIPEYYFIGVRPAFILNEEKAVIKSGSGTKEDPYVLDGKGQEGIAVFVNGKELISDQPPVMEDDRVLVPMRAIFEDFGAAVEWNDDTQTVTAWLGEDVVTMQIDNPIITKNGEEIAIDVPAKLQNDRTLVPVRAVSESLGAKVEWLEGLERVVIFSDR